MKTLEEMTKDERSLLLFFETACTDQGGIFDPRHMNQEDAKIMEAWKACGFIQQGRLTFESIKRQNKVMPLWVLLSDEAWVLAHQERRARHARLYAKRSWETTDEKRARG